ncbi:unnamed protein product [Prorocentrum cordatum]|uniref:Guanylate cyclase domain-containing protein n=1 Tax=Prorocentrum cordatum TaxID=2364126 RepID=A0ABN9PEW3_9DINO|nr:unnamed protein product [Polarella glacialis]
MSSLGRHEVPARTINRREFIAAIYGMGLGGPSGAVSSSDFLVRGVSCGDESKRKSNSYILQGDHPTNAVKAAVGMLAQLDRINKWSVKQSPPLPEVGIRCGIHTGTCLVGNMGFASRIKYGVVGENANIPGRLEEMNKNYGTNNLMSAETYKRLDHTQFAIRPIDYVHLRQRDPPESEPVYEVLGVGVHRKLRMPVLQAVAKRHAEAMELYIEQRFSEALPLFDEVNSKMQELTGCEADQPSVMLQARHIDCMEIRVIDVPTPTEYPSWP